MSATTLRPVEIDILTGNIFPSLVRGLPLNLPAGTTLDGSAFGGTWGSITGTLANQTDLQAALDAKQASLGFTAENVANKSTNVTTDGASDTKYPSAKAVKTYADSLVVGLIDDRGNYDASVNTFPASGGSGTAGAILKGDLWYISVAGTLGGIAVTVGSSVRALTDTPGQTAGNWDILSVGLGYVPQNVAGALALAGFSSITGTVPAANIADLSATYQPVDAELTSWAAITRASGFDTFATTPSSANLRSLLTDENGTGAALFNSATNPTFLTSFTVNAAGNAVRLLTDNITVASDIQFPNNGGTFALTSDINGLIQGDDTAYDATSWNANTGVPTKNALRDKFETGITATTNANLTGHVTSTGNAAVLGSFTLAQLNTAVSDADVAILGANTFTAAQINSTAGAASAPAHYLTGALVSGGTGTTSFPHIFYQTTGATASTTWSTAGTVYGANLATGATANFIDFKLAGASTSAMKVTSAGVATFASSITAGGSGTVTSASSQFIFGSNATIYSTSAGVLRISNLAGTWANPPRLDFGNDNNSFPAIGTENVNGFTLQSAAGTATWNDASTAGSGTVANRYLFGIAAPTLTATNTSVTDTVASTFYIGGAPTASTNTTIGTAYALYIAAGKTFLGGGIAGKTDASAATAGNVGEVISSTIVQGSAVSLTTGVTANVTSISLTAGDWDVWFEAQFETGATTTITLLQSGISETSATIDFTAGNVYRVNYASGTVFGLGASTQSVTVGPSRKNLSGTTTIYGVSTGVFGTSTVTGWGILRARRVR